MLQQSPLRQKIVDFILRCRGGTRWRPCKGSTVVPFGYTEEQLNNELSSTGWCLALTSSKNGKATLTDGQLSVPGDAVLDPLCPSCTISFMKHLQNND